MAEPRKFEFQLPDDMSADELIAQARKKAREARITLEGDESGGTFEGTASGRYAVVGRTVNVEVTKKPAFIPWSVIESGLKKTFG